MAAEADKVVVELIAENAKFDATVKQSAASYQQSMSQIEKAGAGAEGSHKRLTASMGNSRIAMLEFQHVARSTSDQIAAGAPLTQILTGHIGQLSQAVTLAGGTFGKFGAFLGGPYGLALTVAAVGVATLIAKHHEEGDAVEEALEKLQKHHKQIVANDEAQQIYDRTVEGSIDAMNKLTAEIDKQNLTLEDNIALKKAAIAGSLADVVGNIGTVSTQLSQAILAAREAQRLLDAMQSGGIALGENPSATIQAQQVQARDARQRVADLTSQLIGLNAAAEGGARALRSVDFPLIERDAKAAADPIATINRRFDAMAEAAKKGGTYTRQWATQNEKLRDAAIQAAQAAERLGKSSGQFGRAVSFSDAEAIARSAGLMVTSGYRSTAHQSDLYNDPAVNRPGNPVARPGTSAHEGVNGKWALDIAFAPGLTAQSLKKLYGDEGVTLSAVYKEKGHFHIEGSRTGAEIASDRATQEQLKAEEKLHAKVADLLGKETEVKVVKEGQAELTRELVAGHRDLDDILRSGILPSLEAWDKEYEQIKNSQEELNRFGQDLLDDVLNPDNWRDWGEAGKRILHELEMEIFKLAALNPLKNLLFGSKLPTLLGSLTGLFGGAAGLGPISIPTSTGVTPGGISFTHFAKGGQVKAGEPIIVGEEGPEIFTPGSNGAIIPNGKAFSPSNVRAVAPGVGLSQAQVHVLIEASKYFDGRVMEVSGPVIAQASVAAANGGATLGRRNLGREQMHTLER